MHLSHTVGFLILTFLSSVSANLAINNWCNVDVYIYQANPGINNNCDTGSTGRCGESPWRVPVGQITYLDWISNQQGTSVKMTKGTNFGAGILQYEYTMASDGLYWDLSDLDGRGPGLVGTPFANDNVKISPTPPGEGQGTCIKIRCPAGQVCLDAYQAPDDKKTRWCPTNTGTMWIDLCQPQNLFVNKRAIKFFA